MSVLVEGEFMWHIVIKTSTWFWELNSNFMVNGVLCNYCKL